MVPYLNREQVCGELRITEQELDALVQRGLISPQTPDNPERYRTQEVRVLGRMITSHGRSVEDGLQRLLAPSPSFESGGSKERRESTRTKASIVQAAPPCAQPAVAPEDMFWLQSKIEIALAALPTIADTAVLALEFLRNHRRPDVGQPRLAGAVERLACDYNPASLSLLREENTGSRGRMEVSIRNAAGILPRASLASTPLSAEIRLSLAEGLALIGFVIALGDAMSDEDSSRKNDAMRIRQIALAATKEAGSVQP